jgi:hypothetical protein
MLLHGAISFVLDARLASVVGVISRSDSTYTQTSFAAARTIIVLERADDFVVLISANQGGWRSSGRHASMISKMWPRVVGVVSRKAVRESSGRRSGQELDSRNGGCQDRQPGGEEAAVKTVEPDWSFRWSSGRGVKRGLRVQKQCWARPLIASHCPQTGDETSFELADDRLLKGAESRTAPSRQWVADRH